MPRKQIPISTELPYHISARCTNREWFSIPLDTVWEIMENYLYFAHHAHNLKIHSFVLMANHFHLIARTPDGNLSEVMNYFMRETSRQIAKEAGRINQIYGARFHRTLIHSHHYYLHAYKYVYRNPVEAKVTQTVTEYPYSTLAGLLGQQKLIIPVEYDETLFSSFESTLQWLNKQPDPNHYEEIKKALKKREFKLFAHQNTRKPSILEKELY